MYPTLESVIEAWRDGEFTIGDRGPGIRAVQQRLLTAGFDPKGVDGWYGANTEAALKAAAESLATKSPGDKLAPPAGGPKFVAYDDAGGLDLRPVKRFGPRAASPSVLVLHWPGWVTDAAGLTKAMSAKAPKNPSSTHFAVDSTGVYQLLPLTVKAWHATWINGFSVGIDICQSPEVEFLKAEQKTGKVVAASKNPTKRGAKDVLTLDPTLIANTRWLVTALASQLGIPLEAPRKNGVVRHDVVFESATKLGAWSGVVGHHHCSAMKWDVACWWDELFGGTTVG